MIRIDRVGLTTVQDGGRPGFAHLGVPTSGAVDRASLRLANRLVGNTATAAALETYGGLYVIALRDIKVVLTGADCEASIDARPLPRCKTTMVRAGQALRIDRMSGGTCAYLAFGGGLTGNDVLGSLAHDVLSGLVALPLNDGVTLQLGDVIEASSSLDIALTPELFRHIALTEGPHYELFSREATLRIANLQWTVSQTSNRIGIRLNGGSLGEALVDELESFPLVRGAVQVTPNDELVVMVADHPTTGGYPVVAVVDSVGVDQLSQSPTGTIVRFDWRTL